MAVDRSNGRILLFGGASTANGHGGVVATYNDTWVWTGSDWRNLVPQVVPGQRLGAVLAWDESVGALCLHAGSAGLGYGYYAGEVWIWQQNNWVLGPKSPFWLVGSMTPDPKHVGESIARAHDGVSSMWWRGSTKSGWRVARDMGKNNLRSVPFYDYARRRMVVVETATDACSMDCIEWNGGSWERRDGIKFAAHNSSGWHYNPHRDKVVGFDGCARGGVRVIELVGQDVVEVASYAVPEHFNRYCYLDGFDMCLSIHSDRFRGWITWCWSKATGFVEDTRLQISPAGPLVYDAARQCVVMPHVAQKQTWEWRPATGWQSIKTSHIPTSTSRAMAYDRLRRRTVLYLAPSNQRQEIWEYDGVDWYNVTPSVNPPWRTQAELVYAPEYGGVILIGGTDLPTFYNGMWAWDGKQWSKLQPSNGDVSCLASNMNPVYDYSQKRLLLMSDAGVGSSARMWELRRVRLQLTEPLPRVGDAFNAEFRGLRSGNIVLLAMSLADSPGVVVGPSAYGPWGMRIPLANDEVFRMSLGLAMVGAVDSKGDASVSLMIPKISELRGVRLHFCGVTLDPAGIYASNGEYVDIR